jgi:hypothetical protein
MPDKRDLYLDLLKKTLTFALWDKTALFLDDIDSHNKAKKLARKIISKILSLKGFTLARVLSPKRFPAQAHTMLDLERLDNLQFCVEDVIENKVPGDFIETGVWRGGACILMRAILKAHGIDDRRVFAVDSFQGLPKPESKEDSGDKLHTYKFLQVSLEEVKENFRRYGLLDSQVIFLRGWFKDTLRTNLIKELAVLRLDGDMYQSTMDALTHLYPKLSRGGYCIIDDWNLPNAQRAVIDYRKKHNIVDDIRTTNSVAVFWQKSK